jgi:DNA topoisomerase-1
MTQLLDPQIKRDLKKEDLRYTSDDKPGFFRQRNGSKFTYYTDRGKRVTGDRVLDRINSLAIPPAWKDVWISPFANGHLQATGFDDRKRKQYIYHPDWVARSQENKFSKMVDFAKNLPKIRGKIDYNLRRKELDRERILATVVWLLEKTFIRIGNEEYSRENNSFGLTTLRRKHAKVRGQEITFRFRGKSGVESLIEIDNPVVAKTIKECIELPGYELFQFIDEDNNRRIVDSGSVNAYLKELTNDDFTAKDFRTWGATNLSARNLYSFGDEGDEKIVKKNVSETIKEVAKTLNNTTAVCRTYYIHPTVISSYIKRKLVPHFDYYASAKKNVSGLSWNERALVKLLQKY